jgi:hypothetical protein
VSHAKYGAVAAGFPHKIDALKTLQLQLDMYLETGRLEYLIDAANYAMIEFMHPRRTRFVFPVVPYKSESTDVRSAGRQWVGESSGHEQPNDVSRHTR